MALLLAATLVFQGVSTVPVFASEGDPEVINDGTSVEKAIELTALYEVTIATIDEEGETVWYKFTPEKTQKYQFYAKGELDTKGLLYSNTDTVNAIAVNDDFYMDEAGLEANVSENNNFWVAAELTAGETYYLAVTTSNGTDVGEASVYVDDFSFMVTSETTSAFVDEGKSINLEVKAEGGSGSYTYQWYTVVQVPRMPAQAVIIPDATAKDYKVVGDDNTASIYRCVVTDTKGRSKSLDFAIALKKSIVLGEGEDISATAAKEVLYAFTPSVTGKYCFYDENSTAGTEASLYLADNYVIGNMMNEPIAYGYADWETGLYSFECQLEAGETYYYVVKVTGFMGDNLIAYVDGFTAFADETAADDDGVYEVCIGKSTDLKVVANDIGGAKLTYKWYAFNGETYDEILGATAATYKVEGNVETFKSAYRCEVSNGTKTRTVDFDVALTSDLTAIREGYKIVRAEDGESVRLSVNVSGGEGVVSYKWMVFDFNELDYVDIPGEVGTVDSGTITYSFPKEGELNYKCVISDDYKRDNKSVEVYFNVKNPVPTYVFGDDIELEYGCGTYQFIPTVSGVYEIGVAVAEIGEYGNYLDISLQDGNGDLITSFNEYSTDETVTIAEYFEAGETYYLVFGVGENDTASVKFDIENCEIAVANTNAIYNGSAHKPSVTVEYGETVLVAGTDYEVSYKNNTAVGTATIVITGKGDYVGSVEKTFKIKALALTDKDVTVQNAVYDGTAKKPVVVKVGNTTLKEGTDYKVTYTNNVVAGKATAVVEGLGNYSGKITKTFEIAAVSINGATVTVDPVNDDGTAKVPAIKVVLGGKTLVAGTDYTYVVSNNTNKGTASVVVTGKGNYTGTKNATFVINAASIANATVTVKDVQYKGKPVKSAVTVKVGGVTLKEGTDYTVTYSNNKKIGTAKVTITGIGNYAGTKVETFKIKKGAKVTVGSYTYEITGNDTVAFAGIVKSKVKKTTTVKTGDTVKISGKKFKVTSIAKKALYKNTKVKTVKMGKYVATIGTSAFEGCTKLSSVTIGAKVTKIGDKAFKKCTALKKITIPTKVTTIGKEAFSGAKNLKTITVKATKIKTVGKNAFKSINKKATIKVPSKQLKKYKTLLKKGQAKTVKIKK